MAPSTDERGQRLNAGEVRLAAFLEVLDGGSGRLSEVAPRGGDAPAEERQRPPPSACGSGSGARGRDESRRGEEASLRAQAPAAARGQRQRRTPPAPAAPTLPETSLPGRYAEASLRAQAPAAARGQRQRRTPPAPAAPTLPETSLSWMLRLMLTAALRPLAIIQMVPDPEWHACCFPRPDFADSCHEQRGSFSMQNLKEFYEDCVELKDMVWYTVIFPVYSVCSHIIYWRQPCLSAGLILYWWFVCFQPRLWLPSLPLLLAFWLHVMRSFGWRNDLMAHQALVPLSQEGLNAIAAHNSSRKMYLWLMRLIKDRGGWVTKPEELRAFAKRRTHKDGKPLLSFSALLTELRAKDKTWITWNTGQREKKCRCGVVLQLMGSGAYRSTANGEDIDVDRLGWRCTGLQEKGSQDFRCCSGIDTIGEHLGIRRYVCHACQDDYCALCAVGGKKTSVLLEMPFEKMPLSNRGIIPFEKMLEVVTKYEEAVEDAKETLLKVLSIIESCCSPSNSEQAKRVYAGCGVAALGIALGEHLLRSEHSWMFWWPWRLICAVAGSFLVLQRAAPLRRARTAWRATSDLHFIRLIRAQRSVNRWRFFVPEDPRRAEAELQEVMSQACR